VPLRPAVAPQHDYRGNQVLQRRNPPDIGHAKLEDIDHKID